MIASEVQRFVAMVAFFESKGLGVVVSLLPFDSNAIMVVDKNDMVKFMGRGIILEDAMNELVNQMREANFV